MVSSIYKWNMHRGTEAQPSAKALADLARRRSIPDTRDNTGRLLGDPEPGRSALDKRREAERRRAPGQQQSSIEDLAAGAGGERDEA